MREKKKGLGVGLKKKERTKRKEEEEERKKKEKMSLVMNGCSGPFWLNQAGLPPAVLGPNILSKGVETSPTTIQFDPACAQTMPRLPGARLRRAELFQMSRGRQI